MSGIIDEVERIAGELNAAGIRATIDPRAVNPPCVLLVPPAVVLDLNCGGTAEFTALVIVPSPANSQAWRLADRIAADASAVIPVERIEPSSYAVDDTGALPALSLSWQGAVSWP
jgi:hypothetical protein